MNNIIIWMKLSLATVLLVQESVVKLPEISGYANETIWIASTLRAVENSFPNWHTFRVSSHRNCISQYITRSHVQICTQIIRYIRTLRYIPSASFQILHGTSEVWITYSRKLDDGIRTAFQVISYWTSGILTVILKSRFQYTWEINRVKIRFWQSCGGTCSGTCSGTCGGSWFKTSCFTRRRSIIGSTNLYSTLESLSSNLSNGRVKGKSFNSNLNNVSSNIEIISPWYEIPNSFFHLSLVSSLTMYLLWNNILKSTWCGVSTSHINSSAESQRR